MIIFVKNKDTLLIDDFKFRCSIGKNGFNKKKYEGDFTTPKGKFNLGSLYLRGDRKIKPITKLDIVYIKKNMGWCNDIRSKRYYNKLIKIKSNLRHEKLYRKDNIYDLILVLNYNMNPIKKNKGSAIFIHVARKNFKKTEGCIALKKTQLIKIIKKVKVNTYVKIVDQK